MTVLLDCNLLVALTVGDHVHHDPAEAWLEANPGRFATCPVTEGALVRLLVGEGESTATVQLVLRTIASHPRHEHWPDDVAWPEVSLSGLVGHRQVTDAYLASLAARHGGLLATLDPGLAGLYKDVCRLVPVS